MRIRPSWSTVMNENVASSVGLTTVICGAVERVDRLPIWRRGAAERIHTHREAGAANRVHVDHVLQIPHVRQDEVFLVRGRRSERALERDPLHTVEPCAQQLVGAALHPGGDVGVGGAAVGRVVLEAAVLRRIVRRRDDDPVRQLRRAAAVIGEDRPRDDGRRRDAVLTLNDGLDPVRRQHLERGALRRVRQGVRVLPHVERAVDALPPAILADRLRHRGDVRFGERAAQRRAAVPAGPEAHELGRIIRIRRALVVGRFELTEIHQDRGRRRLARERRDGRALPGVAIRGLLHPRLLPAGTILPVASGFSRKAA